MPMGSTETSRISKPASQDDGLRVRTVHGDEAGLQLLSDVLKRGELVAIPTETVYGLAGHALDEQACRKIFNVKGRPLIDPLIVHVRDAAHAESLAVLNNSARSVMCRFWPGPLTLVLPKRAMVPGIVTAGLDTVAIRCPRHPLARKLLEACGLPLAAPSANLFGYVSPTTAQHVRDGLGDRIDYLLDGGPCDIGLESTILDLSREDAPMLLRPGSVTREELEAVLQRPIGVKEKASSGLEAAEAPGMLERHYSPRTPLDLFEGPLDHNMTSSAGRIAVVAFSRSETPLTGLGEQVDRYWLTEDGALLEAARRVFAILRQLDSGSYSRILFEKAPQEGIGIAINDRLRRAAKR